MKRSYFIKTLIKFPLGGWLAKKIQSNNAANDHLLNKFYVAGFQYYQGLSIINEIAEGDRLQLNAVPDNTFDSFAVEIYRDKTLFGHISRTDNKHISRLLQQQVSQSVKLQK